MGGTQDVTPVDEIGREKALSVVVVDRLPLVAAGVSLTLAGSYDLECLHASSNLQRALAAIRSGAPDVVLIDLELPDVQPATLLASVRAESADSRVLFLAPPLRGDALLTLIEAGAVGVVERGSSPERILDAIRAAGGGRMVASAAIEVSTGDAEASGAESGLSTGVDSDLPESRSEGAERR